MRSTVNKIHIVFGIAFVLAVLLVLAWLAGIGAHTVYDDWLAKSTSVVETTVPTVTSTPVPVTPTATPTIVPTLRPTSTPAWTTP